MATGSQKTTFFFPLAFLHVDGNILVVNIQTAERGSNVCIVLALHSAGWALLWVSGHKACPSSSPWCLSPGCVCRNLLLLALSCVHRCQKPWTQGRGWEASAAEVFWCQFYRLGVWYPTVERSRCPLGCRPVVVWDPIWEAPAAPSASPHSHQWYRWVPSSMQSPV